ncbi:hypothetical protein HKT18_13480 [Flavobacterium sp. IMCC34852]|uniref:G8 domain-containing protein n=1 Tax=Flavobacterium rivulicola TaxID=2732161 RepID=A0A7Y3W061_9FLAO|nr:hypothetical protein [Flavobacterium sp. IMCC34852]NNT73231.1 hypothetical protein [Flavobacterium sp. IMCC34852]
MFINYFLKSSLLQTSSSDGKHIGQKPKSFGFAWLLLMLLSAVTGIQAQTTIINPATDGGFNLGSTFAANGWTVANEGTGAVKWAVGTAVSDTTPGTTQTASSIPITSYTVTLSALNQSIAIGQSVSGANIQPNTYVSNISGTTLTLTLPTTNATAQTNVLLTFGALASNISGNSAYLSLDNGVTHATNISGIRTIYFYKDVVIPAGHTNIALSFDWKSAANTWQVFVAPTTVTPIGSNVQSTFPNTLTGATPIIYSNTNTTTQSSFGFIPASFAGTTARIIFMWSNGNGGGTNPPLAVDNISLVSRAGGQTLTSVSSGLFTSPSTWDLGYVPSPSDDVVISAGHTVDINEKITLGARDLAIAGSGAVAQFGFFSDQFTVSNDLFISGSGARFNVYQPTNVVTPAGNGRLLKVGHDISFTSGGRLDISFGTTGAGVGELNLNGSTLQTISTDAGSFLGGTTKANGTTNTFGIINQLTVTNTSTATPNIDWQVNNARIRSKLTLTSGRVALGSNKIILGNYGALSTNVVCSLGTGFIGGTVARWYTTSANPSSGTIDAGLDYNNANVLFPIINANGQNRWASILSPASGTVAGELAITYADANTMSAVSIVDGITIGTRYDGNWTITTPDSRVDTTLSTPAAFTYTNAGTAFALGFYATGAFATNDGSTRILYGAAAAGGTHINGTTAPFAARSGLTLANITANGPMYVGGATTSVQGGTTKTSTGSGDWNTAGTWTPSGVPACGDIVTIASGHTVTVNATASAAGVTINAGGTLVNAGGTLTVGCTNNNAIFTNFGTSTVSGGTLRVNGGVYHRAGSTFNHTGGDVTIDSNDAGNASTSVGQGGSSLKLDTPNLNLTGGTITIVDPLINNVIATSATSVTNFTMTTFASTFAKPLAADAPSGSTVLSMTNFNRANTFSIGQVVSGTGIAPGTTITALTVPQTSVAPISITLSQGTTATILTGATIDFSAMNNGSSVICVPTSTANWFNIAVGQIVTGNGIPAGTTVTGAGSGFADSAYAIFLSNPVTGLATSPIIAAETITFSGASPNCSSIILPAANPLISVGQAVSGTGIAPGTTVTSIDAVGTQSKIGLSLPCTGAMVAPVALNFYAGNLSSFAVAYNATTNYVAGLNHTLQIGDGVSTDKAAVTTNGFLCNFIQGGGMLSLGNLTVNALDGADRFFNVTNVLSVQNALNITSGSVFKKTNTSGGMFFGGNITNNGSMFMAANTITNLANGALGATTLPQTISGSGNFYNNLTTAASTGSFAGLTINNTSSAGVTISMLNFRVTSSLTLNSGIVHTSATYPLYHGLADLSSGAILSGTFSDTSFIDGPYNKSFATNSTSASFQLFPVGKTSYTPVWVGITAGASITAEAYTSNAGTTSVNASNLSATNWRVTREGALGSMSDYKVQLGHPSIGANNIIVQAPIANGTYDNTFGNAMVYTAGTLNTIAAPTAISGAGYTSSYFAYATTPNCTTFNPGNTIADLSTITNIVIQNSSSTGIVNGSANVTLQATASPLIVAGLTVTGNGIQAGTTVVSVSGTALVLSQPATASSAGQTTLTFSTVQNPSSLCGSQLVRLSLQNSTTATGITYQWQSSTDGGTTYVNISGATAATYVGAPTQNTYYRCNVTCTFGPSTVASTPVQVTLSSAVDTTTPGTTCTASTPVNLEATAASGTITWYAAATGGSPLATGSPFTPSPATTTTYYAATESTSTYTVGKSLTGTSTSTSNFTGIVFNTSKNIILNSVKVYPRQTAGALDAGAQMTIKLFKDGVQVPGTDAVTFVPTTNTGTISASFSNTVNLNYNIPAGNGYTLLVTSGLSATNMLARVSPGVATLPAGGGSVTVTLGASSFDTTSNSENNNFFDLNVTEVCSSPRVAVEATVGCTKNLKLFIEGYYIGGGQMTPVKANEGVGTSTTDVDDVTVELRDASTYAVVSSASAVLKTDGTVAAKLVAPAGNYFIAVKHRNAIQTWSAAAEAFGTSTATYDFSTAANKAYGSNMKNLGSGVFGFYSGDINQDESIDVGDFPALFSDNDNFISGYFNTDLNGDGTVDVGDFPILFLNSDNFIFSNHP